MSIFTVTNNSDIIKRYKTSYAENVKRYGNSAKS